MGLFHNLLPKATGVDIGVSSIKIVELSRLSHKIRLENYAQLKAADPYHKPFRAFQQKSLLLAVDKITNALRDSFLKAGMQPKKLIFSVADFLTFFTTFDLPPMKREELETAVKFEAEKYIPLPLQQVNFDWEIISGQSDKEERKILVVSIPKDVVNQYRAVAQNLGIEDFTLEPETFSLHRLFAYDHQVTCLVDIGAQSTSITIGRPKVIMVSHSLNVSGYKMTEAIMEALQVDVQTAEKIKETQGLSGLSQVSSVLEPLMKDLVKGIQSTIQPLEGDQEVSKIILTGGGSKTPGLLDYLKTALSLPVVEGAPFSQMNYPRLLQGKLKEMGPLFSVAVGAALRGLQ